MFKRLISSLVTWPSRQGWADCVVPGLAALAAIAAVAFTNGFVAWRPDMAKLLHLPVILVIPAFTEELLFRGALPARGETQRPVLWLSLGVLVFTLWHVVEALTFLPSARLFLHPAFLACAAALGLACALMRYRTGSLWPGVLFHALVVWLWQGFLAGPGVAELLRA